ncbi:MAG: class I SAM-dependent methyltransferase [Ktedonobacteraceae bacterium]|nr:class I SAM-dependent methyltransferase [Ktedonobacteraceae bacterium]
MNQNEEEQQANQNAETRYHQVFTRSDEMKRLELQGRWLAPLTRSFLSMAGIAPGMRVLDIGSGAGDVSLLTAELVGPQGSVTGIDYNSAFIQYGRERVQKAGVANVSFIEGDIATVELPGEYDAMVGRLVLGYTREPAAIVRRLAASLRPGGIVAFQEIDLTYAGITLPESALFRQGVRWIVEVLRRGGMEVGLRLYSIFTDAGLPAPQMALLVTAGGGPDWAGYENLTEVVRGVLPQVVKLGLATEEEVGIDTLTRRLREEAVRRGIAGLGLGLMSAWTRVS